jgi:hypothetical protein
MMFLSVWILIILIYHLLRTANSFCAVQSFALVARAIIIAKVKHSGIETAVVVQL